MKNFVYYNELFDCYSLLLTEKEKECFKDYYNEDLSYGEIASNKNISRSAVHKTIKVVLNKLEEYEQKLHILDKRKKIEILLNQNDIQEIKDGLEHLLEE